MPSLRALIALETSAAATMRASWSPVAKKLMEKIKPLLEAARFEEAHGLADQFTLMGVVSEERRKLEELAVSAILFGARNLTGTLKDTSFVKGRALPREMQGALDQLVAMVEGGGADIVRKQLHLLIAEAQEEAKAQHFVKAEGKSLADRLNDAVIGSGRAVIDIGANLTTSRLVNLGFLAEAVERNVTAYQVNETLDARTCPVCRYMHGKTFEVGREYHRTVNVLGVADPKELRSLAPWPSQTRAGLEQLFSKTIGELQAGGYGSPPYHPGCRGVLSTMGAVTGEIPVKIRANLLNPLLDGRKGPAEAGLVVGVAQSAAAEIAVETVEDAIQRTMREKHVDRTEAERLYRLGERTN